ncbi:hypothetical protein DY000_02001896 [Brassica cretica]|uniref:Uncharacterized protein n=1 Tax=Brassica cretica TaxID=69181 RepID=A0ABQ7C664_BRACR|nr:hypothetical protein DY000_02001896 [Brassica cretica]
MQLLRFPQLHSLYISYEDAKIHRQGPYRSVLLPRCPWLGRGGAATLFKSPEGRRREVVVYSHQFACSEDISPNVAALKGLFSPGWTEKHTQKEMQKLAKELSVVVPVSFFEEANNAHYNSNAINSILPSQEMSLNVNTANNIGLGGALRRGETWTPLLNTFCSSKLELEQMYKVQMQFYEVSKLMKVFSEVEMSLNVNTANNIGLGGSFYSISESDWMVMRTRLDDATQFLQQSRGIETG